MLAEAYELEVIRTNAARVRIVVPGDRVGSKPKTMTAEQIAAVLDSLGQDDCLVFFFLSKTGLRISEALGVKWNDIQLWNGGPVVTVRRQCRDGTLREETKTPAGTRSVALVSVVGAEARRASFDGALRLRRRPGLSEFARHPPRCPQRAAALASGSNCGWCAVGHVFRHLLATELGERGYDAGVIAKVLGHRSDAFPRRVYIHTRDVPRFDDLDLEPAGVCGRIGPE